MKDRFHNPILKGGYPDPSLCRVGDTYYMVTSSFYYFPGLPVFRSRDLVHWEQIANAICRPEQLDFQNCESSEGIWAATIRFHNGRFYIAGMLDVKGRTHRYNFILTAENPAGPWSDAVIVAGADGIDPSLYFDEQGRIWFCGNTVPEDRKYPEQKQIYLCELDPKTFQFRGERRILFDGAWDWSLYMEGPHLYRIDGMYYLMTACGGTQTNHCVNLYRSADLFGPYEPCPRNPVVTNRNLPILNGLGVAVTGHGDLVETQFGQWYMVLLGIRPYEHEIEDYECFQPRMWIRRPDRNKKAQFNLGREVFLTPIAWDYDGWPIVDNENGYVNLAEKRPNLPWDRPPLQSRVDNFECDTPDMIWCMRRQGKGSFYSLTERPGFLRLKLLPVRAEEKGTPAMLVRRQQHNDFHAAAAMEFEPQNDGEESGLIITQNERFSFLLLKEMGNGENYITVYRIINGKREMLYTEPVRPGRLYLHIEGEPGKYSFYYGCNEREMRPMAVLQDGSILSTLVADGYIGTYLGMYASSGGRISQNHADFDWFRYEIIEE